ncbi:uncharacterized protein LOC108912725 [Anoplophora glabripennis]|uniref:uncharacterized protein LOC108912725 n=1 Tax=Anoplophora glabripennis TaxID=217634 RepID=UPI00087422E5|nr:uncharacterized protein LOC108912725 [Anoplophora glabripennis]XP_018573577.1 uncharacterized protein LOC108912725 [Anoplophora glabripennis]
MSSALTELCRNLQDNTEKLEDEIKRNIVDCHKLLIDQKATQIKLALEKAKDFHYKEVLDILKEIVNSIRKIIYHEQRIRTLDDEKNVSPDELKRYSYVQRQVQAFSNPEEAVTKREKRRVASAISVESLEAWELYLDKKEEEEKAIQVEVTKIPKRLETKGNRKKKKRVSSTFNNFLDSKCGSRSLDSILEEQTSVSDRLARVDPKEDYTKSCNFEFIDVNGKGIECDYFGRPLDEVSAASLSSIYESDSDDESFKDAYSEDEKGQKQNLSTLDILETLNEEYQLGPINEDTKPKIVDVVYKKKEN